MSKLTVVLYTCVLRQAILWFRSATHSCWISPATTNNLDLTVGKRSCAVLLEIKMYACAVVQAYLSAICRRFTPSHDATQAVQPFTKASLSIAQHVRWLTTSAHDRILQSGIGSRLTGRFFSCICHIRLFYTNTLFALLWGGDCLESVSFSLVYQVVLAYSLSNQEH